MTERDSECFCGHYDRSHDDNGVRRCRVTVDCDCSPLDPLCGHRCDCPGYEPKDDDEDWDE